MPTVRTALRGASPARYPLTGRKGLQKCSGGGRGEVVFRPNLWPGQPQSLWQVVSIVAWKLGGGWRNLIHSLRPEQ